MKYLIVEVRKSEVEGFTPMLQVFETHSELAVATQRLAAIQEANAHLEILLMAVLS